MNVLNFLQWSKRSGREKILIALVAGLILYAPVLFFFKPRLIERKYLDAERIRLQEEMTALTASLQVIIPKVTVPEIVPTPPTQTGSSRKEGALTSHTLALADLIDMDVSLSTILGEIGNQARLQGVNVIEVGQGDAEKKDAYEIIPIQVKVRARFRNLEAYVASLEALPRPMVVDRLKIEATEDISPDVVMDLSLRVYKKGGV